MIGAVVVARTVVSRPTTGTKCRPLPSTLARADRGRCRWRFPRRTRRPLKPCSSSSRTFSGFPAPLPNLGGGAVWDRHIGVFMRRNALTTLMSIELILNSANLTLLAFARSKTCAAEALAPGHCGCGGRGSDWPRHRGRRVQEPSQHQHRRAELAPVLVPRNNDYDRELSSLSHHLLPFERR